MKHIEISFSDIFALFIWMSNKYFVFRLNYIITILLVIHTNTRGISTVMISQLTPVCSESHTKTLNTFSGHSAEIFNVK